MRARLALAGVLAAALAGTAFAQSAGKLSSNIGYPTVATAYAAVQAKPGVRVTVRDGWTIMEDRASMTVWSFTPPGHPAHPSVARREVRQAKDGRVSIQHSVRCEAAKAACDKLNAEFRELNDRIRRQLERDQPRPDRLPPQGQN
jgi:hypothetical protein